MPSSGKALTTSGRPHSVLHLVLQLTAPWHCTTRRCTWAAPLLFKRNRETVISRLWTKKKYIRLPIISECHKTNHFNIFPSRSNFPYTFRSVILGFWVTTIDDYPKDSHQSQQIFSIPQEKINQEFTIFGRWFRFHNIRGFDFIALQRSHEENLHLIENSRWNNAELFPNENHSVYIEL